MTFQQFLNQNTVDSITREVIVSDRFKNDDGEIFKFKIKAMTQSDFEEIKKKALFGNIGNGQLDEDILNCFIIIENTLEPSFKDSESLNILNCSSPRQYLNKVLLSGEIAFLAGEIIKLSGFDRGVEELSEDVKN